MRKWLAVRLFDLAVRLDWDEVFVMSLEVVMIDAGLLGLLTPKKKAGRPKGSKDKKPRKSPVRKVQS
jgi:hypothetical protein